MRWRLGRLWLSHPQLTFPPPCLHRSLPAAQASHSGEISLVLPVGIESSLVRAHPRLRCPSRTGGNLMERHALGLVVHGVAHVVGDPALMIAIVIFVVPRHSIELHPEPAQSFLGSSSVLQLLHDPLYLLVRCLFRGRSLIAVGGFIVDTIVLVLPEPPSDMDPGTLERPAVVQVVVSHIVGYLSSAAVFVCLRASSSSFRRADVSGEGRDLMVVGPVVQVYTMALQHVACALLLGRVSCVALEHRTLEHVPFDQLRHAEIRLARVHEVLSLHDQSLRELSPATRASLQEHVSPRAVIGDEEEGGYSDQSDPSEQVHGKIVSPQPPAEEGSRFVGCH
mmetsp:Transcript_18768/g.61648  ORF Transcript_18768/g.61648 Transcript_18768/m.61648 type:complete len:337 (-) Transcript_18768:2-1012(-)